MTAHTAVAPRPIAVWAASGLLAILAFLTAVGGVAFNLAGAEDASDVLVGLVFVAVACAYAACAIRVPSGDARFARLAVLLASAHALFNAVVKVGIEGESESAMFIVLGLAVVALLMLPASRRFL